ncbi:5575_t:CDS:2 [Ambispora gerdemannii]|uniref:5575_t:CDS:1 n=1 Tax=Ambispora gerdemannii TaxID=144530 RepID=A0A9N8YT40_9GLOM|nr:5575_t:CDS:2 [Ambispora gerdemannii]
MQTSVSPSSTPKRKTAAERAAEREKKQQAEQKERERKVAEKAAEKEKREIERKAKLEAKEAAKKERAQSKMGLMNYFSPIKKEPPKEEKGVTHDDPKLASFYSHFRPFYVKLTMTMAPINRFEHPVPKDFDDLVFGESLANFSEIPQKTADPDVYLRDFLSIVNKKLLKKRGARKMISVKDLMQGRFGSSVPEPVVADMEIDTEACDPVVASIDLEDRSSSTDNDKRTMDSEVTNLSENESSSFMGDPSEMLKDLSKTKMKLLQFYEDFYRPAYYGLFFVPGPKKVKRFRVDDHLN